MGLHGFQDLVRSVAVFCEGFCSDNVSFISGVETAQPSRGGSFTGSAIWLIAFSQPPLFLSREIQNCEFLLLASNLKFGIACLLAWPIILKYCERRNIDSESDGSRREAGGRGIAAARL